MSRARGVFFSLAISLYAALMLAPAPSNAQSGAETLADLRACGAVERDRARLACFDGVLAAERAEAGAAEPSDRNKAPAPASTPAVSPRAAASETAIAASRPAAQGAASPTGRGAISTRAISETSSAASIDSDDRRDARAAPAPRPSIESTRGRQARVEPLSADQERPGTVMIVDLTADRPGDARFITETGQVLIQTSGGTPPGGYPDVPFEATLEDGAFGSLFLGIRERRRIRVKWVD